VVTRIDARASPLTDTDADAFLGDLLVHMNRGEEAARLLEKTLAARPDLALAHTALGMLQLRQQKTAEGMGHLKQAVMLGSTNETVYFRYALGLMQAGRDQDALREASAALDRAIVLRPGYSEAKVLLGFVHLAAGNFTSARDLMAALVRAEPTNHRAALQLGDALLRLDDIEGVRAAVGPVLARSTDEAERDRARRLLEQSAALQTRRETLAAAGLPASGAPPPAAGAPSAAAESPGRPPDLDPAIRVVFRPVGEGEQRVYGVFEAVECGQDGVVLVVRTATSLLRARAASFMDIDFIAYRPLASMAVNCGPQTPRLEIYLTWRAPSGANAPASGTAVAVEILPEGFIPAR
jgi:tetratricopeptide (TPR) repeat protein